METITTKEKAKNFFEYMLALNNLVGKVVRNYADFEKNWQMEELEKLEGCLTFDKCHNKENLVEIHRPTITNSDLTPPAPKAIIKEWLNFDPKKETAVPSYITMKTKELTDGEVQKEYFIDEEARLAVYEQWVPEWKAWSANLKNKKRTLEKYEEFFELISRFEKEGESLEFIYGTGLFTWKHRDPKIGAIRSPLLTSKVELELDAIKSIISVKLVDQEISVEREIFSGIPIPNIALINQMWREVQTREITEDFTDFFTQFIQTFDANGKYVEEPTSKVPDDNPVIYNHHMLSLRIKNARVLRDDLAQIIDGISTGELELSDTVASIIGEPIKTNTTEDAGTSDSYDINGDNNLYFPLESNEQQKAIIQRISRHQGVTVQGPPGTGKTHTIANLVSHFLSEGKKILITSQKESPLKVLKNKIPQEIRDLCVPVLGGGRESLQEIEQSIRVISEKLGELDVPRLEREIERDKEALNRSKREEAKLKNLLKEYAEKEGTVLQYKGEKLFKYDVAKRLSESDLHYSWIQDTLAIDEEFPLNPVQFKELWQLKSDLAKEQLSLRNQKLPEGETDIQNASSFAAFVDIENNLEEANGEGKTVLEKYQLPLDEIVIQQLQKDIKGLLDMSAVLENPVYQSMMDDCRAGGTRETRWRELIEKLTGANERLFESYNQLITHKVELPQKTAASLKEDVAIAKEPLQKGKKPNFLFFLGKGKQAKYLFEEPVLNGEPVQTLQDIGILETHLEYEWVKKEAARLLNGNMEEIGHNVIDEKEKRFPHLLDERLNELQLAIQTVDLAQNLKAKLVPFGMESLNLYSVAENKQLSLDLEAVRQRIAYLKWEEQFNQGLAELVSMNSQVTMHAIGTEFAAAYQERNVAKWIELLKKLEGLHQTKTQVLRFYELLEQFNKTLPLTGQLIKMSVGSEIEFPKNHTEAFEMKKLQSWLDETKDTNTTLLKKQLEEEHVEQKRLIRSIVSASTWKNQVERITEEEKRALSAWKTYIKRFGKGSGKSAQRNLQGAREEMKTAQTAIPVWIMPISQVLENFPVTNEKFDVIIFDESSQCDLFAINVLLRGKKIVVVGDDEQISPQSIGTKQEDVYELVRRHLKGIPNADLFDGNLSLYEIAEQTFPKEGKLMLREHFRCVPEIIQFSNDMSYGGEMIPLRLPLEEDKIDPPVTAIKVNDGVIDDRNDVNEGEIDAIVADMAQMIRDPKLKGQTFGVITLLGQDQHKLLESRIRQEIGDREFVERKIICGNPYTLQGDERDIIFLSMVSAPNRNFRALTGNSDKQRFNVAASRAKNQMRLYHSVDLEELNPEDLRYRLLSYCQNPTRFNMEVQNLEDQCDSPFEVDVLHMLLSRGYKVTPQVKVGQYRIDMVVEGIRDRLAVECDGERWHGPEKFEEDMKRQESLERAGWKFWRVRGREFYFDKAKALESLWVQLDALGIEPVRDRQMVKEIN
ncbi:AAA domain-containing protein [Planococcus shixiaomingii]|uniref:AAA domain-containing protein n=1 Tax=Planococcus shixiaomingii TaxID=3058393 RepID=UPI00261F32EC|nr:AAA domain-containing protein [Planococcus sp. N022]WKA53188.1 AAA domain-containing protein [Planococcus sp. N022]